MHDSILRKNIKLHGNEPDIKLGFENNLQITQDRFLHYTLWRRSFYK